MRLSRFGGKHSIDILILLICIYSYMSATVIGILPYDGVFVVRWLLLLSIYLLSRFILSVKFTTYIIITVALLQSCIVIGQQLGILHSNHALFSVTGFLLNPGQLGGFQAISLSLITAHLSTSWNQYGKNLKIFQCISCLLIGYSLIASGSRAGLLATSIGIAFCFKEELSKRIKHPETVYSLVMVSLAILTVLIFSRKDSVLARLFIWMISLRMFVNSPILGSGIGSFKLNYMFYQADYFKFHPDSVFIPISDNVAYPFNEILQCLVEQGIVGTILIVVLFVMLLRKADRVLSAPIISFIAFSMVSYPSHVGAIMAIVALIAGMTSKSQPNPEVKSIVIAICAFTSLLFAKEVLFVSRTKVFLSMLFREKNEVYVKYISSEKHRIVQYPFLGNAYLMLMLKYPELADTALFDNIVPSCENLCDMNKVYLQQGMDKEALKALHTASYMIPTRIQPNYLIWKYHIEHNNTESAVESAKKIVEQPTKGSSTYTIRMRSEVKEWIDAI